MNSWDLDAAIEAAIELRKTMSGGEVILVIGTKPIEQMVSRMDTFERLKDRINGLVHASAFA